MPGRAADVIYLDHNATTPLDEGVLEAMLPWLREGWGNPSSPYRFGSHARAAVERARTRVARALGGRPEEIVFCSSGTESDNLALRGVARALASRGNHVVTTMIEHHAVRNTCRALEKEGLRVTYLPVSREGFVDPGTVAESLGPGTILVSVMHANNETGVLQPVEEIASITRKRGIPFHVDAVQSAGKVASRLADLGADLVTLSGHKLYGPKGSAVLYVREGTPLVPVTTGGAHERGLRAGTENVAAIVGLAEALDLSLERAEADGARLSALRDRLEAQVVSAIPRVKLNGAGTARVPNTSNISFPGIDGESLILGLDVNGICVSSGSACSTGEPEPSGVLLAMGLSAFEAQGAVRFSLGRGTTGEEIDTTVTVLSRTVSRLRELSTVSSVTD